MQIRKIWNYAINVKKEFILRKEKIYILFREERKKIYKFINKQLRKEYIRLSKSPQIVLVFFFPKRTVKSIWYKTIIT